MFRKFVFQRLETINDYKNNGYKKENPKRNLIKVCFIDDRGFNTDVFRSTGYTNVDTMLDYKNSNEVAGYDIIACDIDGIGLNLDRKRQGLAVAETIIAAFPEKVVLIYSSNNPYEYDENYHSVGDGWFNKSLSNNEIAKIFDEKAAVMFDEIAAWGKIEKILRRDNISNKTIAYIEDLYVKSLKKKVNLFENNGSNFLKIVKEIPGVMMSIVSIIARFIK